MAKDRYLFRGFHKEESGSETIYIDGQPIKGEWYFGSLIYDFNKKWYIHENNCSLCIGFHEVIPETISQYTGLEDKSGVKIFEEDIVMISAYSYDEPEYDGDFKVIYDEVNGYWYFENIDNNKSTIIFEEIRCLYKLDMEVIGTKFDKEVKDNETNS